MSSNLTERLDRIRAGAAQRIPAEALAVMHAATEDLVRSGQAERAVGVSATAPELVLPDTDGRSLALSAARREGPVVLTFFRGHW
jgi:hypothetical protein